jgi:hypothetical protein
MFDYEAAHNVTFFLLIAAHGYIRTFSCPVLPALQLPYWMNGMAATHTDKCCQLHLVAKGVFF